MTESPDIFISYAPADAAWTNSWLLPKLKAEGLQVTSADDLLAGGARTEQISREAERSLHTLLVLSPDWVASQWETFTGLISLSTDPVGRKRRTIPLLRHECQPPRSIARLVSADFVSENPSEWEKEFSRLLAVLSGKLSRTALGPPLGALVGAEAPTNFKFRQNPYFVGREQELAKIHELLDDATPLGVNAARTNSGVAGLTGLGGVGKTQLVVEYIHRYGKAYPGGIFWINAADGVQDDFAEIGRIIVGDGQEKSQDELIRISYDYLRGDPDILLVVDNLNEPSLLNQEVAGILTPISLPCRLLFTTRRQDLRGLRSIAVDMLDEADALRLLLRSRPAILDTKHPEHAMAIKLCATLGGLPLAIEMAAAYLEQEEDVQLSAYLTRLGKEGALQALDTLEQAKDWSPTWHDPIQITLQSQWDTLTNLEARLLLQAAALMPEAAAIPLARLSLLTGLNAVAEEGYPAPLASALRRLHNYSLIEKLEGDQVRLHPLVREFVRAKIANLNEFSSQCSTTIAIALKDMLRVNQEILERGVDALLADLQTGLNLNPANVPLEELRLVLDQEAHNLRKSFIKEFMGYILQQIYRRAFALQNLPLMEFAEVALRTLSVPWLRERFPGSRESPALLRTFQGHTDTIYDVAISPDGERAISASHDKTLRLWDLDTGRSLHTFQGHTDSIHDVAITPDGKRAISTSWDKTLRLWDLDTGECLHIFEGHTSSVDDVAITPDGKRAISTSWDRTLRLWDLDTGECLRIFEGHISSIHDVAITPDGKRAISTSWDKTLRLWDLDTGECLRIFEGHTQSVGDVAISPDGKCAISASNDKNLRLWDLDTGECLRIFEGHTQSVSDVAISPDGERAISTSLDKTLRLWDLDTGRSLHTFQGHTDSINDVAITPNGKRAISTSWDKTLRLWDLDTGECLHIFEGHIASIDEVAITPDGKRAISTSLDGTLRLWDLDMRLRDLETGRSLRTFQVHKSSVRDVAITPDGKRAISASSDGTLRLWELNTGKCVRTFQGHTNSVSGVAITPDGKRAISASSDDTLRLWDLNTGMSLRTFQGYWAKDVAITPDGKRVISASNDGVLRMGDIDTRLKALSTHLWDVVTRLWDFDTRLWDTDRERSLRTFQGHKSSVNDVAVTPDGKRVISASWDKTLRLWDLDTGECLHTFRGHTNPVNSVAITLSGKRAISASSDDTLRLWDLDTGECLRIFQGHTNRVSDVAITPDGKRAVSVSEDKSLRLWDLENGQALSILEDEEFTAVAFHKVGNLVAAGTKSGTVRFLDIVDGNGQH